MFKITLSQTDSKNKLQIIDVFNCNERTTIDKYVSDKAAVPMVYKPVKGQVYYSISLK